MLGGITWLFAVEVRAHNTAYARTAAVNLLVVFEIVYLLSARHLDRSSITLDGLIGSGASATAINGYGEGGAPDGFPAVLTLMNNSSLEGFTVYGEMEGEDVGVLIGQSLGGEEPIPVNSVRVENIVVSRAGIGIAILEGSQVEIINTTIAQKPGQWLVD